MSEVFSDEERARAASAIAECLNQDRKRPSIDPAEAAHRLTEADSGPEWRAALRLVKAAALALEAQGELVALRKGKPVPLGQAKGVVRLAFKRDVTPGQQPSEEQA